METNRNSFDILRYYAAIAVMMLHFTGYYAMRGASDVALNTIIRKVTLFMPGVVILFTISGYLMAMSLDKNADWKHFLWKKAKRIYPQLWMVTIFNCIVLMVLVPNLLDKSFLLWIVTQIFGIANTPSCLKDFATGSVNGTLWTVFVQMQMFAIGAIAWKYIQKWSMQVWGVAIFIAAGMNLLCDYVCKLEWLYSSTCAKLIERTFIPYFIWYLIGMFCYCHRERMLVALRKVLWILLPGYLVYYILDISCPGYYANIVVGTLGPFIVIGLAYSLPAKRFRIDITYELFLVHWIVLNCMLHFEVIQTQAYAISLILFIGVSILLSLVLHYIYRLLDQLCSKWSGERAK